ncbi:hypothetical protein KCP75_11335 [Salmonella enterica subsp. enterica]|nr:hypothetical protein KCP75_11335 [Salmonella enterica subsp. enterica]
MENAAVIAKMLRVMMLARSDHSGGTLNAFHHRRPARKKQNYHSVVLLFSSS